MEIKIKNWLTQIKKGYLDLCILTLIQGKGRTYGFELITELSELGIDLKEGTLYPLLNRMTKDGQLSSIWETENIQGHPRKFYALTKSGAANLEPMKEEYQSMYKIYQKIKKNGDKNGK